jgi:hypothetical protein
MTRPEDAPMSIAAKTWFVWGAGTAPALAGAVLVVAAFCTM